MVSLRETWELPGFFLRFYIWGPEEIGAIGKRDGRGFSLYGYPNISPWKIFFTMLFTLSSKIKVVDIVEVTKEDSFSFNDFMRLINTMTLAHVWQNPTYLWGSVNYCIWKSMRDNSFYCMRNTSIPALTVKSDRWVSNGGVGQFSTLI